MRNALRTGLAAVAAVSCVAMASPLAAQDDKLDLSQLTCKEMMKLDDRDREAIMGFYFGHASAKNNTATLDLAAAGKTADKVIDDCLSNSTSKAMEVFAKHSK